MTMYIKRDAPVVVIVHMSAPHEASYHPWLMVTWVPRDRAEWLEVREALLWDAYDDPQTGERVKGRDVRRIGGSGLATLYGKGYMTIGILCQSLRGCDVDRRKTDNTMLEYGVKYEEYARVMYRHMFMDPHNELLAQDPTRRFGEHYVTSPDNIVVRTDPGRAIVDRVVEYKCPYKQTRESLLDAAAASPCGIPERYLAQLELYCRAVGTETADLCILFGRTPGAERYLRMSSDELDQRFEELYNADRETFDAMCTCLVYRRNDAFWTLLQDRTDKMYRDIRNGEKPRFGSGGWPSRSNALAEVRRCFSTAADAVEEWPDIHTE